MSPPGASRKTAFCYTVPTISKILFHLLLCSIDNYHFCYIVNMEIVNKLLTYLLTYLHAPEWIRTSDPVIKSPARSLWNT